MPDITEFESEIGAVLIYVPENLSGSGSCRERIVASMKERMAKCLPGLPAYSNYETEGWTTIQGTEIECLTKISELEKTEKLTVASFYGFAPFLDSQSIVEMSEMHFKYFADFTVAENMPYGFAPDLIRVSQLSSIPPLKPGQNLREGILAKLNELDVEIYFRLPDIRQWRLNLSGLDSRSEVIACNILGENAALNYEDIEELIRNKPQLMRPAPSCIELELTTDSPVYPIWFLRTKPEVDKHMSSSVFGHILKHIEQETLPGDFSVILGGQGEPLQHPDINGILEKLLFSPAVKAVYLETFGAKIDAEFIDFLSTLKGIRKLSIIIRLTTLDSKRYSMLYGKDMLGDVMTAVSLFEKSLPDLPIRVYAEMLRIVEVEDKIEEFFNRFKDSPVTPLAQKWNTYAGRLPERRVSDLTPMQRDFCWHLARDIYVRYDGSVPICKQLPLKEDNGLSFSIINDSIKEIFSQTEPDFVLSFRGEHEQVRGPCSHCDEWYTFNA